MQRRDSSRCSDVKQSYSDRFPAEAGSESERDFYDSAETKLEARCTVLASTMWSPSSVWLPVTTTHFLRSVVESDAVLSISVHYSCWALPTLHQGSCIRAAARARGGSRRSRRHRRVAL